MTADAILEVKDLDVRYGAAHVLFKVSLEVKPGSVLAILGPNGAGKSTLARAISGLIPTSAGSITFDGHDVTQWPTHRRQRAGMTYVPEGRGIFPGLSVIDNLRMSVRQLHGRAQRETAITKTFDYFPALAGRQQQAAGSLSGGQQQMLALGRVLAVEPRLVIADEMSLGLAPIVVDTVFEALDAGRRAGVSVILIEQFVHRALELADQCIVLRRGEVTWKGDATRVGDEVLAGYFGVASEPA